MNVLVRLEQPGDKGAIRAVTEAAFRDHPYSDGGEPVLVDRLRANGDLALSLVAEVDGRVAGHIAFSPVTISDGSEHWYGLGPVSVLPDFQRRQIGAQLIRDGLEELARRGARGVVLLGSPEYYSRFGFAHDPALTYPGPPAEFFQRLVIAGKAPTGVVRYAPAFG